MGKEDEEELIECSLRIGHSKIALRKLQAYSKENMKQISYTSETIAAVSRVAFYCPDNKFV